MYIAPFFFSNYICSAVVVLGYLNNVDGRVFLLAERALSC